MHPNITVFCAFTRLWAIERWIDNLANSKHDPASTNLVFIVDADEPNIKFQLNEYAKTRPYKSVNVIMNEDNAPNEIRIAERRQRIAQVKNQSKALISATDCEYVIGLEDDTVFGGDQLMALLEPFKEQKKVGFVEGVQCGRWGVKIIGAWTVDNFYVPEKAKTIMPPIIGKRHSEIDAGGFYGYATTKELYINHDYYSGATQPYGPDVNFGLWVRAQGYRCLIDWHVEFGHNDHDKIILPDNDIAYVSFTKNRQNGHWDREDVQT